MGTVRRLGLPPIILKGICMTIFIDLDGVIADFDGGYARLTGAVADKRVDNVDWNLVNAADRFFYRLKPSKI